MVGKALHIVGTQALYTNVSGSSMEDEWLADAKIKLKRMPEQAKEVRERAMYDLAFFAKLVNPGYCLLYTSPSPRDQRGSRMPSSA